MRGLANLRHLQPYIEFADKMQKMTPLTEYPAIANVKTIVGNIVASWAHSGQTIGLGSGSTALAVVNALGKRIEDEGIEIFGVASSYEIADAAIKARIQLVNPLQHTIDWAFDGADEIDYSLNVLKGRGGAMLNEKIIDSLAERLTIVVDSSKLVESLGQKFPVPIEVIPIARELVLKRLKPLPIEEVKLRMAGGKDGPVITEHGNVILDCWFQKIEPNYEPYIASIPGVAANGLFFGIASEAVISSPKECFVLKRDGTREELAKVV